MVEKKQPLFIAVTGGSAAGKTTFCKLLQKELPGRVSIISIDSFYKNPPPKTNIQLYDFDDPNSLDWDYAYKCIKELITNQETDLPVYSFKIHQRLDEREHIKIGDILLIDGLYSIYDSRIKELMNMVIYIHCDDDIRLSRRIKRDINERGRNLESVLFQWDRFVKKAFDIHLKKNMNIADLVIPWYDMEKNEKFSKFFAQSLSNSIETNSLSLSLKPK